MHQDAWLQDDQLGLSFLDDLPRTLWKGVFKCGVTYAHLLR